MSRIVCSHSIKLGSRKYGYSRRDRVSVVRGSKVLNTSFITWLPSQNVGKTVEITLLSITEAEISCVVVDLSIEYTLSVIKEAFNIQQS